MRREWCQRQMLQRSQGEREPGRKLFSDLRSFVTCQTRRRSEGEMQLIGMPLVETGVGAGGRGTASAEW